MFAFSFIIIALQPFAANDLQMICVYAKRLKQGFLLLLGKMRKVQTTEELMADLKERTASEIEELRRVAKNAAKENPLSNLSR